MYLAGLQWLLRSDSHKPQEIIKGLHSESPILRMFAGAAAARLSSIDPEPLLHASRADDADVKRFAKSALTLL